MALSNYAALQTAVLAFIERTGQTAEAPDWITLAEARLNRELGAVETETTLTGTADSRRIDISSISVERPIALMLAETGYDEVPVLPRADGTFVYRTTSDKPRFYAIDGTYIDFDCPLASAYPFRFRYRERFALSGSVTTNWLLTYHPDVYLAASIVWGHAYNMNFPGASAYKQVLDEAIPSIKNSIAAKKRSVSTVDPALLMAGRLGTMTEAEWTYG